MKLFLIAFLLQSVFIPPRMALENPAAVSEVPQKLKKDYDKLWARFLTGKEDAKVSKDLDNLLKRQKDLGAVITLNAYLDLYQGRGLSAAQKFDQAVLINPNNRIALYYLAELAFASHDYARASDLYSRLLAVDKTQTEVEAKRQKALLLATENTLRSAVQAVQENRLSDAEELYRRMLNVAPNEPSFHGRLAELLAKEKKWDEALVHYRRQMELAGRSGEIEKNVAEALGNLGRSDEAREILERLRKEGSLDKNLETKVNELEDLGRWGNQIDSFREIKMTDSLTREQLAALIVRYFPQVAELRQEPQIVTDVQTSWAEPEIQVTVGTGLIDSFPNHTFQPSAPISRWEFAISLSRLARLLGVVPITAPSIAASDVASGNALYADVRLVLGYGLMGLDDAGNFNINAAVSGEEAVRAVDRLLRLPQRKGV